MTQPALGFLDGGVDGEGGSAVGSVQLEGRLQLLDLLLLPLGELLRLLAGGEAGDVGGGRQHRRRQDDGGESERRRERLELGGGGVGGFLVGRVCLAYDGGGGSWLRGELGAQFGRVDGFREVCGDCERHFFYYFFFS